MLARFSKIGKSFPAKILFGLLTISFLAWSVSDVFHTTGTNDAARVGKTKISLAEIDHSYRQYLNSLRAQGIQIAPEQAKSTQLAESVLKARVQRELFSLATRDSGLIVSDDIVAAQIRSQKMFHNDKGAFDRDKYNAILKQNELREKDYVENLRTDTASNLLLSALKSNVVTPDILTNALYQYQNETRSASLYVVPFDKMKIKNTPTAEQLAQYLKDHQDKYKLPELRSFTVATLSVPTLAQSIPVSEEEIAAAYETRKDELKKPEERDIQFVSLPDKKTAQKVAEASRGGDKLLASAKSHGAANAKLESLKSVTPGTLPAALDKAVFSLGRAETSDAIETPLGWYVVQILNIKKSDVPPLKDLHDKIRQSIQLSKADDALAKTLTGLDDAVAGGATLEELAKTYPLRLAQIDNVARDGTHKNGQANKLATKEALESAFLLNAGQTGAVEELPGGDSMIVRVTAIEKEHVPDLADIRAKVTADYAREQQEQAAAQYATELQKNLTQAKNGEPPALQDNVQKTSLSAIKRNSREFSATTSPDLVVALFGLKKPGEVATGRVKDGIAVARLTDIAKSSPATAKPEELASIRSQLQEQNGNAVFDIFIRNTEEKHHVAVNQDAVLRLYNR